MKKTQPNNFLELTAANKHYYECEHDWHDITSTQMLHDHTSGTTGFPLKDMPIHTFQCSKCRLIVAPLFQIFESENNFTEEKK